MNRLYNAALIFIGVLDISYVIFGFLYGWDFYFGMKVIALCGVLLLLHGILRHSSSRYRSSFINKVVNAGIILTFIFVAAMESVMGFGAYCNNAGKVDYVLILGAGIVEDRPSYELQYRLDKAIQYIQGKPDIKKLVLCGGQGKNKRFTDAYVMEKYLLSRGISQEILLKEEKSTTTSENIQFAKELLDKIDQNPAKRTAIVSNDFHVFRAKHIADKLGLKASGISAETPLYIIPSHHVREYFAILKCLIWE